MAKQVALRLFCIFLFLAFLPNAKGQEKCFVVEAGNAESLLQAIEKANKQNADSATSKRLFILIPDGVYDLGERVLTTLKGHNISLMGQSMEKTIIRNAPLPENEGIGKTATLLNQGTGLSLHNLTLQNALDYYRSNDTGRAVCLQDKGTKTICKHVRMLSYQDTYYSYVEDAIHYFEDSEIHGTVDFICGAGDVYFNRCLIVTEPRHEDGSGRCVIAAPRTSKTKWGYIFDRCTIRNVKSDFHYARGWNVTPRCIWLNTRLETPERLDAPRFDPNGMRTAHSYFKEYGTTDAQGRNITPQSNVVTFTCKGDTCVFETVMGADEARRYSPQTVFPKWRPDKEAQQLQKLGLSLMNSNLGKKH